MVVIISILVFNISAFKLINSISLRQEVKAAKKKSHTHFIPSNDIYNSDVNIILTTEGLADENIT
jgi:hypothetical protein